MSSRLRALELFSGIGGFAQAVGEAVDVVLAIDQKPDAMRVYAHNHPHPQQVMNLVGARADRLPETDLWWMSPPCQPYTVRGARRDLEDRRADSFKALMNVLLEARPRYLALENVPLFHGSRAHALLRDTLQAGGYQVQERMLCPTELGVPAQRRRFYLVAGLELVPMRIEQRGLRPLGDFLADQVDEELVVEDELRDRFGYALHVVDRADPEAVAACFTSAYGNSPVYAGSYLRDDEVLRRFHPIEIARLMGFDAPWALPEDLSLRRGWSLVGNSLSIPAVRAVLTAIPELREG